MSAPAPRGYQRSWKNLLINKEYQLRFTLIMVAMSAILLAGLGWWVMSVAKETTRVGVNQHRGDCSKIPDPIGVQVPSIVPAEPATATTDAPLAAGPDVVEPKRSRVVISDSSITMTMTLPANFGTDIVAHWQCVFEQDGAMARLHRGETRIRIVLLVTSVLLILGLAFYGIKMTHKVAGPLFKVSLYLNKMRDGRFDKVWNLRKGDQLVDFYEHFKAGHAGVVALQQGDIEAMKKLLAAAETAQGNGSLTPESIAKLDELRALIAQKDKSLE
jgi:hypothetical protein